MIPDFLNFISHSLTWQTAIDLLLVYLVIYYFLIWMKSTHSYTVIRGVVVLLPLYFLSQLLDFKTINWLMAKLANALLVILIIIFQPELRRFLERLGRGMVFNPGQNMRHGLEGVEGVSAIKQILRAVEILSRENIGALIVIEQHNSLSEYVESGIALNSTITAELLVSLFWPGCPTHDGAVILQQNRIVAAECLLPLTNTPLPDDRLGTRHRAALGISELTDALVIVVSEENGIISITENGKMNRYLNKEALETRLFNLYKEESARGQTQSRFKEFIFGKRTDFSHSDNL